VRKNCRISNYISHRAQKLLNLELHFTLCAKIAESRITFGTRAKIAESRIKFHTVRKNCWISNYILHRAQKLLNLELHFAPRAKIAESRITFCTVRKNCWISNYISHRAQKLLIIKRSVTVIKCVLIFLQHLSENPRHYTSFHIFALRPVFRMYRVRKSVTFKESSNLIIRDTYDFQSGGRKLTEGKPWEDRVQQNHERIEFNKTMRG